MLDLYSLYMLYQEALNGGMGNLFGSSGTQYPGMGGVQHIPQYHGMTRHMPTGYFNQPASRPPAPMTRTSPDMGGQYSGSTPTGTMSSRPMDPARKHTRNLQGQASAPAPSGTLYRGY